MQPISNFNTSIFSTPDQAPDYIPIHLETWSNYVSRLLNKKASEDGARFFNPAHTVQSEQPVFADISWPVFPNKLVSSYSDEERWAEADRNHETRDSQDEYCEWSVKRNHEGKIVKVVFTCELPEYWNHIAKNPQYLLAMYRQLNPGCDIKLEDLYINNQYNPRNKWNIGTETGCAVHMLHPNNMLDDLVELAARATVIKRDDENHFITDGRELVRLAGYSSWQRSSDPHVAQEINKFARDGKMATLANPIGVFFERFLGRGKFRTDSQTDIPRFWTFSRGQGDRFTRMEFEVPPGMGYVLDDIIDIKSGRKIKYGAQLADHLRVKITGQVIPFVPRIWSPLWSYIAGRNTKHEPLSSSFISSSITDYFGQCLATVPPARHPHTLRSVVDKLPPLTWVPFVVHEGLHIPGAGFSKKPRIIIICTPYMPTQKPPHTHQNCRIADVNILKHQAFHTDTLCIVGSGDLDDDKKFLQCAGFDPRNGWFNFYEHATSVDATGQPGWLYFGCSKDAFEDDTQGKGVFCGHVNGALVMKELEIPWVHWHSSMSPDLVDCLHESNPLLREEIMHSVGKADDLEIIIVEGLRKWFDKRCALDFGLPPRREAINVRKWVSHALLTTTVNIGCSVTDTKSVLGAGKALFTPKGFFYNEDCLNLVLEKLGSLVPKRRPVSADLYKKGIENLGLCTLENVKKGEVSTFDEGQAPWKILTPSREDTEGIRKMLDVGLLSKKHLAAMLMIDFCNPIYSSRRATLMKYIPETALCHGERKYNLGDGILANIIKSPESRVAGTSEAEFLSYMKIEDFDTFLSKKVLEYLNLVEDRLQKQDGVEDYLKLAESRRRIFRPPPGSLDPANGLAEFDMSIPYAKALPREAKSLVMTPSGMIEEISGTQQRVFNSEDKQSRFSKIHGCPFAADCKVILQGDMP